MNKFLPIFIFLVISTVAVLAQPMAAEGKVEYQKGDKPAAIIELPYKSDIVEKAIKDNMFRKGIKPESSKGFQVYKGARLTPTDGEVADLYFKVDRKSRKEDNVSIIYLVVGRPNENVSLRTADDTYRVVEAKSFLNDLVPSVEAYNLEVTITEQEEVIKKAEKKQRNLEDDQKDLEKKIRNLEEKLAQNKREQEAQAAEVTRQRSARDAMQARRIVTQ